MFLTKAALFSAAPPVTPFFEELRPGVWRGRGAGHGLVVTRDGFLVDTGQQKLRFRWGAGLALETLSPDQPLPGRSYRLSPDGRDAVALGHSRSVRAGGRGVSVRYYYGPAGWEFDLEKEPGVRLPDLRLESIDATWTLDADGNLRIAGQPWIKAPVAWTEEGAGKRALLRARFRLLTSRLAALEADPHDPSLRVVIDPVLTYATYFAGTDEDKASLVEELPDGSILLAGNTRSQDLPQGVLLSEIPDLTPPRNRDCFVARIVPAEKRIDTVSYFGTTGFEDCRAIRRDSSGRIVLFGVSDGSPGLTTPDAEELNPGPVYLWNQSPWFLARISSSLRRIEYATFLQPLSQSDAFLMAGPEDSVYIAAEVHQEPASLSGISGAFQPLPRGSGDALLLRYDIAQRRYTARTYFGGSSYETVHGVDSGPGGAITIFGATTSGDLPLRNPVQSDGPKAPGTQQDMPAFVAAFSPDLRELTFATYLGGQAPRNIRGERASRS